MVKAYFDGKLDENNASIISLTGVTDSYLNNPNFGYIANFLPMVSYNEKALSELLSKENIDCTTIYFKNRLLRAKSWLEKYGNSKIKVLDNFNEDYYKELTDEEKSWVNSTLNVLEEDFKTSQELQTELFAIVKNGDEDQKELKNKQKRYFQIIYNLILGEDNGPKMGLLLSAMPYDVIKSKLQKPKSKTLNM